MGTRGRQRKLQSTTQPGFGLPPGGVCNYPLCGKRSVEDAVRMSTGDEIAGATGAGVKFRAERKLGGSAEALAPHRLYCVFIRFGDPQSHGDSLSVAVSRTFPPQHATH